MVFKNCTISEAFSILNLIGKLSPISLLYRPTFLVLVDMFWDLCDYTGRELADVTRWSHITSQCTYRSANTRFASGALHGHGNISLAGPDWSQVWTAHSVGPVISSTTAEPIFQSLGWCRSGLASIWNVVTFIILVVHFCKLLPQELSSSWDGRPWPQ